MSEAKKKTKAKAAGDVRLKPDEARLVLRKDVENIVKKAAAGKTLTKAERDLLESAAIDPTKKLTVVELAKHLGITAKTVYHLRKNEQGPSGTNLDEWKAFLERRSLTTRDSKTGHHLSEELQDLKHRLLRAQAGKEEANRRLKELQLEQTELGLVPMGEAKAAIRRTLGPLRELLDTLPKAVALQANPAEPVHAEEAVREGLDRIFKMMEDATPIDE
tara:strand:+ start:660 stop:1313 length:654 start_codon:yes stop_codon:yes gene_type:complete